MMRRLRKRIPARLPATPTSVDDLDGADLLTRADSDDADGQDFVIGLDTPQRPTPRRYHGGTAVMTEADIAKMFNAVFGKMPKEDRS